MNVMLKSSKNFMPTYVIIMLNVVGYVYTSIISGDFITTGDNAILLYGQVNSLVINYGWYWQLFTSIFVHVSIVHLLGNMFFLLIFGLRAEELFSLKEYLLIYFLSGLAGNLLSLAFGPYSAPGIPFVSAGASGAIFGVFGACIIYIRRAIGQSIITALMYAFFLFMINIGPGVNFLAHLGGLAVGLLIGYVLGATRRRSVTPTYEYRYSFSARG
jgi:rhomboid protease GluP